MSREGGQILSDSIDDARLFGLIARQDVAALSLLYDRHAARLYGLALKILKNETYAQDVVQELFIYLWENAAKFDEKRGKSLSWMMILCRNRCIDKLRSIGARQRRSKPIDVELMDILPADESDNPLEYVNLNEVQAQVQQALAELPEEQRQPILLAYFDGMSQTEIAGHLKLPLGTVKTRVRLAMQKLRGLMLKEGAS